MTLEHSPENQDLGPVEAQRPRVIDGGKGLVATSWLHTISRDGDPQLHVHLAVLNAVQRADGVDDKWRAADGQHFYQLRHLYGVTVDRAFEQQLLDMGYAMTGRADGNGAEIGGVSQQVMDRFSSRAQAIDGRLRTWVDQYTARHGTPPSRRTIYLMGQQIAKDTRRPRPRRSGWPAERTPATWSATRSG